MAGVTFRIIEQRFRVTVDDAGLPTVQVQYVGTDGLSRKYATRSFTADSTTPYTPEVDTAQMASVYDEFNP